MNASIRTILTGTACGAALLVPAGSALAHGGDRDHDGLSDRYERAHGLSLKVNSALGDPDHDGLSNRLERRFHLDPKDRDTDDDGTLDGAEDRDADGIPNAREDAGKVTTFTGGILTVTLGDGTVVKGRVSSRTELECKASSATSTAKPRHAGDQREDEDDGDDRDDDNGDDRDENEGDDDDGTGDDEASCTSAALVPGARVLEADLRVGGQGTEFTKVELVG